MAPNYGISWVYTSVGPVGSAIMWAVSDEREVREENNLEIHPLVPYTRGILA